MTFLRFIRLLSLTLWIGSIFFFAIVEAPTLFAMLPTHALAGMVVSRSLFTMHWIGIGCGLIFLLASVLMALLQGGASAFHARDFLLVAMMAITLWAHFGVERRMVKLRDSIGVIDNVPVDDARRVEFNRMHIWSTRMEGSVFFLGLALLYLVVREQETSPRRY
jgi:Domain of unknown function (DUF4149)